MNHGLYDAGDCYIHFWTAGPEGAPLIVLSPGAFTDHSLFEDQVFALSETYRLLAWDPRGHGRSRPYGRPFTPRQAADDLIGLLDHLGEEKVALLGQSMGGYVSQEMIFKAPERVSAAILLGCTSSKILLSPLERLLLRAMPPIVALMPTGLFKRQAMERSAFTKQAQAKLVKMAAPLTAKDVRAIAKAIALTVHREEGDDAISHPILICYGDRDRLDLIPKAAAVWQAETETSELAVVPEAGHAANLDNPAAFNRLALAFFGKHL